jgi:single-strand DNA-binding protein
MNKVILIGNVGAEPKTTTFDNGSVTNFSLATTERWKDKNTGEQREATEWHNVVFYRMPEGLRQYVNKGTKVAVEGTLKTRSYEANGVTKYVTEVVVSSLELLGGKPQATNTEY